MEPITLTVLIGLTTVLIAIFFIWQIEKDSKQEEEAGKAQLKHSIRHRYYVAKDLWHTKVFTMMDVGEYYLSLSHLWFDIIMYEDLFANQKEDYKAMKAEVYEIKQETFVLYVQEKPPINIDK